ncbi:MAG: M28 family peptidase [Isosphaeraceae bacterium]
MRRNLWIATTLLTVAVSALGGEPEPEVGRLRAHIATLASPEFAGRRGEGAHKAAEYVETEFKRLDLEPLFDGGYTQEIPGRDAGTVLGRNVGAKIVGSDPALRDEWIILGAHFDHLGVRSGVLYPGADDNASSVAMMIEVARSLSRSATPPRRSLMFLGFDLEEDGLFGSRYFIDHMPVPLDRVKLMITADMIGRSLGGVCGPRVFVMGTEHAPSLRPWITRAADGRTAMDVGLLGSDLLLIDRSDYGPFRARKVPYLFFSTGENPHYHKPTDTAETLDYPKIEAVSRTIQRVVEQAAAADSLPTWEPRSDPTINEAVVIRDVLQRLLEHRDDLNIKPAIIALMTSTLRSLDEIIDRGVITAVERSRIVRTAQIIMFTTL